MSIQSSGMTQTRDRRFSPSSNAAGAPLPLIPRRISSSPSMPLPIRATASTSSLSSYASSSSSTVTTTVTPLATDSDVSSSSSPSSDGRPTIRTRRVRGVRANGVVCPPEMSTPMPTLTIVSSSSQQHIFPSKTVELPKLVQSRPLVYTPGMSLRSGSAASRNVSESTPVSYSATTYQSGSQSASALCETFEESRMIRKKSGQVVKSSLKSSRSSSRSGSLSVDTMTSTSKSEPTTPTSKAVHFDSKLEHVKLFLSEQKPLAVSRDGSPTDDTSGTDSDFPRFIFATDQPGDGDARRLPKKLVMQIANMPIRPAPCIDDVALEELCLAPDGASILGKVRVRNLAFSKWIAVRFTFDSWQTTSEVTGKYLDSPSSQFDRFSFAIRLNDLLARIEGKTLLLAVKYSIEGREMWDNNRGQNYLVTFTKAKVEDSPLVKRPTTLSDDEASTDMMDLRNKLEKVVNPKDRTGPAFNASQFSPSSISRSSSTSRGYSASPDPDATSFRTSASFASRYDFAASSKRPWNPDAHVHMVHNRTQSFPLSRNSSSVPWPQKSPSDPYAFRRSPTTQHVVTAKTLGSPRDIGEDAFQVESPRPFLALDSSSPLQQQPRGRNHQRGYFDLPLHAGLPTTLKLTPPRTPRSPLSPLESVSSPARCNSFPSMDFSLRRNDADNISYPVLEYVDSSELSTPSMVTPSSSRESTPSPSPTEFFEEAGMMSPDTHYRYFLNKFCFFTGPGSTFDDSAELPRTHSASDIEEFLSGLPSHLLAVDTHEQYSPSRSSSLDDVSQLNRSGSLTPTLSRLGLAEPAIAVVSPTPLQPPPNQNVSPCIHATNDARISKINSRQSDDDFTT